MINALSYIVWNPDITAFRLSFLSIRWYSLCWLVGLLAAYLIVKCLYEDQKISREKFEPLFLYCFVGVLVGARLGHCLFYEPAYFLSSGKHVIEMFLPIHFRAGGGVEFTGYEGLASHGGTIGLFLGILLYYHRYKVPMWVVLDNIAIATPLTACFIRLGNLMNSEIIGTSTSLPWAFIFERVDLVPRHPAQLYEAIAYLVIFFIGLCIYRRRKTRAGKGFYFGMCLLLIFAFRFVVEYAKVDQVEFEESMSLNMGQLLSIPFVLIGAWCVWRSKK